MRRALRWTLNAVLTAAVTLFLFRALRVSWGDLTALDWAAWRPRLGPLVLSVAVLLGVFLYLTGLWARLMGAIGAGRLRFLQALRVFFLAQLGRYIPGKVWQIAGLAYLASREGVAPGPAAFSAALNQVFHLAAALTVGALYLWVGSVGPWGWSALAVAALVALVLFALGRPELYRAISRLMAREGGAAGVAPSARGPRFTLTWLGLHAVGWLGYGGAFCLLWAAFRPLSPAGVPLAVSAFAAAYFLGYAAFFAPAGIGVREGALAALTAPALGAADATALAVVARIWMTATELLPVACAVVLSGRGALERDASDG